MSGIVRQALYSDGVQIAAPRRACVLPPGGAPSLRAMPGLPLAEGERRARLSGRCSVRCAGGDLPRSPHRIFQNSSTSSDARLGWSMRSRSRISCLDKTLRRALTEVSEWCGCSDEKGHWGSGRPSRERVRKHRRLKVRTEAAPKVSWTPPLHRVRVQETTEISRQHAHPSATLSVRQTETGLWPETGGAKTAVYGTGRAPAKRPEPFPALLMVFGVLLPSNGRRTAGWPGPLGSGVLYGGHLTGHWPRRPRLFGLRLGLLLPDPGGPL
jgi:hypothetical protein